jgi:hypothetical protein
MTMLPVQTKKDVASGTVTYNGEAQLGTAETAYGWSISKTEINGNVTTVSYPIGMSGKPYNGEMFQWSERANYTYSLTPDTSAPVLSTLTIASDNSDTTLADVGDTVTLTIVANESIYEPTVTIKGLPATVSAGATNKAWTAARDMVVTDTDGIVTFSVAAKNFAQLSSTTSATTDGSAVTFDNTNIAMVSAARNSNTQITVTLSELALASTIAKANAGGFTVVDTVTPATTYAVSGIAAGGTDDLVVLTVANMAVAATQGVTVKYTAGGNGTVTDKTGNPMVTTATGVVIAAWDAFPTMVSAERIANTTVRVKMSEVCDTGTTTKANAGGFVVKDTVVPATTYAVSAIAPNGGNHDEIDLTVATIVGSATTGVTVTYVKGGNGTVADDAGYLLQTNATGVLVATWA